MWNPNDDIDEDTSLLDPLMTDNDTYVFLNERSGVVEFRNYSFFYLKNIL